MIIFFFNDTATTEIYTLSLHDALPISRQHRFGLLADRSLVFTFRFEEDVRSEEHTSELQSQSNLVCRLLLEKKKVDVGPAADLSHVSNRFCSHPPHVR